MYTQKLIEAAKLIAYDNGAINRLSTEAEVVTKMIAVAKAVHNEGELEAAENFLAHLSDEDFAELCTGEAGAINCTPLVDEVLETLFDSMGEL